MFQKLSFSVVDSALRGDNEVLHGESSKNIGNFLAAVQMIANHNDICRGGPRKAVVPSTNALHYQEVNLFPTKHPRRLELGTILKD